MSIKDWLAGGVAAGALACGTPAAEAALICSDGTLASTLPARGYEFLA